MNVCGTQLYITSRRDRNWTWLLTFIKSLEDIGVEHDELKASAEYDPKLEEAINTVFEEDEVDESGYGDDE